MAASTSPGFCYSEASSNGDPPNNAQTFEQPISEIFNMDMVGFPPKNTSQNDPVLWNQDKFLLADHSSSRFLNFPDPRPIQGQALSLTLSSSNPAIKLQSFDLRQPEGARFGPSSSRSMDYPHELHPQMMQEGFFHLRNSRYLSPAQDVLNEFCSVDVIKQSEVKEKVEWVDCVSEQSLNELDVAELQRRRSKLLHMLEEVNRRYKQYRDEMSIIVSSLEAVAGDGAATVYTAMASRAMSRHFRCLKDSILRQIKACKKAAGEKDLGVPGTTKGETPRLRILDQSLRQQRAFQQLNMMETHPWRPQRGLPEKSVAVLRAWLFEHFLHPYPSDVDKHILARQTGLSRSQVSNWFINARVRLWKPMVEEMYMQDLKEAEGGAAVGRAAPYPDARSNASRPILNPDQKPTHDQLIRIEPETLSSIVIGNRNKNNNNNNNDDDDNNNNNNNNPADKSRTLDRDEYGDFPPPYGYGGGGVSLTLGLHQHGGGGMGLQGYTAAGENSVFYGRDEMENEGYRNLMGAQLLHHLAG